VETEAFTLRELAIQAYEDTLEEEAAIGAARIRNDRGIMLQFLKERVAHQLGLHVEPTELTIQIDGLTFGIDDHYKLLQLHMPCHGCGVLTSYRSITGKMLELGRLLTQYESREESCLCPDCFNQKHRETAEQTLDPVSSTEQQVIIWLTALIRREIAAMAPA
jgi:hypothetical protein